MNYESIKSALNEQGLNWTEAAAAIDCSQSHLCNVANGRVSSRVVSKKLALLLGLPIEKVFPKSPHLKKDPKAASAKRIASARKKLQQQ